MPSVTHDLDVIGPLRPGDLSYFLFYIRGGDDTWARAVHTQSQLVEAESQKYTALSISAEYWKELGTPLKIRVVTTTDRGEHQFKLLHPPREETVIAGGHSAAQFVSIADKRMGLNLSWGDWMKLGSPAVVRVQVTDAQITQP